MDANPTTAASRRRLPWIPVTFTLTGLIAVGVIRFWPELERNLQSWLTAAVLLLTGLAVCLWFLASSRFSGRVRLSCFGTVAVLAAVAGLNLRVDGTLDGTGLPRLVWKGSAAGPAVPVLNPVSKGEGTGTPADDPRLAAARDVTGFFGDQRSGHVSGVPLAADWASSPPRELWRQPIGLGWSAFAVVGGRAYTQEQREGEELVTCYDLLTGNLLWSHGDAVRFSQWQSGDGPHATPTVWEGKVYAYGATGLLTCLDAGSGNKLWQRAVLQENNQENLEWGTSASPLLVAGRVVVTGGRGPGPVLFAYDAGTGAPAWKAGNDEASYASPSVATLAGRTVVLSNNARSLLGCDPASGEVLFEHQWGGDKWPKASQPLLLEKDRIFLSAGYGMGCQMIRIQSGADGGLVVEPEWTGMKMKTQFNSPALYADHAYGLDDGRLACLDLKTGDRLWKEGRFGSGQTLLAGNLILIQSESGPVHLAKASPEAFQELGKVMALSSKTWNHPTLAGRYLLVRNDREAVCYELPVTGSVPE